MVWGKEWYAVSQLAVKCIPATILQGCGWLRVFIVKRNLKISRFILLGLSGLSTGSTTRIVDRDETPLKLCDMRVLQAVGLFKGLDSNLPHGIRGNSSQLVQYIGQASGFALLWIPDSHFLYLLLIVVAVLAVFNLACFLGLACWAARVWSLTLLFPCSLIWGPTSSLRYNLLLALACLPRPRQCLGMSGRFFRECHGPWGGLLGLYVWLLTPHWLNPVVCTVMHFPGVTYKFSTYFYQPEKS